jgi:hypothetical protein
LNPVAEGQAKAERKPAENSITSKAPNFGNSSEKTGATRSPALCQETGQSETRPHGKGEGEKSRAVAKIIPETSRPQREKNCATDRRGAPIK